MPAHTPTWINDGQHDRDLACFVLEGDDFANRIVSRAAAELHRLTGHRCRSFATAVESRDREVFRAAVEALYLHLKQDHHLRYEYERAFDDTTTEQQVRLPATVREENRGTCIDLTVLFLSCLANAKLAPLYVQSQCHALAAVWLKKADANRSTDLTLANLRKLLADGEVVAVECTGFVEGFPGRQHKLSFDEAVAEARQFLDGLPPYEFRFALDIQRAWQDGVRPLKLPAPPPVWRPRVCYPLQPAPHFQGRQRLRADLLAWARARETPDRVVSLVAVGGTGKTALTERVLADLSSRHAPRDESGAPHAEREDYAGAPAGVLVWSFYENPRTEGFLRTACEYFTGETPSSAGGLLERLQAALAGDEPHLLVLDGLERVQAKGTTGRPRGEMEDPQLRRLLRWLAAGQGTRTRALVTSRFPLVDLDNWKDAGHREERLEDLEPQAARAVLRSWGVKGDDATLDGLAVPLHYHALSVAVLGSYLGKLWGGDPTKAPTFDRGEMAAADPKAARLSRILTHYAEKLPDAERDLLARLSTFPRGVTVEFLGFLVDAGGQIAGALAGYSQLRLLRLLEQLRELGLVFRYDSAQGATFTAHPFLREYFRELLDVTKPEEIHEAVRLRLAPGLEAKSVRYPSDPIRLDQYEAFIEHTRLAGQLQGALNLFWDGLGDYKHMGVVLGDYARGLRILTGFFSGGTLENAAPCLPNLDRAILITSWGLFAKDLGDLAPARRAVSIAADLFHQISDAENLSRALQNLAEIELLAGRLPAAVAAAADALTEAEKAGDWIEKRDCHGYLAVPLALMGRQGQAQVHFSVATGLRGGRPLHSVLGVWVAEFKLATGDRDGAAVQIQASQKYALRWDCTRDSACCESLLGVLALPSDPAVARQHLDAARAYASRSGNVEVQLRCYHLATEIARTEHIFNLAQSEAEAGIHLADTCGFGHYAIELRLALARAHLDNGDPHTALQRTREALDRAVHPECQYAWGEADGLHLCGVAHARLGEVEPARQCLTAALAKREQLTHPGLPETRAELARLDR